MFARRRRPTKMNFTSPACRSTVRRPPAARPRTQRRAVRQGEPPSRPRNAGRRKGEIDTRRVLLRLRRDRLKARGLAQTSRAPGPARARASHSARAPRRASRSGAARGDDGDGGDGSDGVGGGGRIRAAASDLSAAVILACRLSAAAPVYSGETIEPRYFTLERWKHFQPTIGASLDETANRFEGKLPSQIFRSLTTGPLRQLRAAMNAAPHVAGALAAVADHALVACRNARLSLADTTIPAWQAYAAREDK